MTQQLEVIRFHNPTAFAGRTGVVDRGNHVIEGVSLITGNMEAEGHNLFVDDTTLTQLHSLAKSMKQIPVTQNHEGGVQDVNGWVDNVRLDGNQIRGDWHLLSTHPDTATMLERAEKQPGTFGISLAFKGDPKGVLHMGKRCARAERLLSADVVKRPACNPMGLFSAKENTPSVDTRNNSVAEKIELSNMNTNSPQPEPTLADALARIDQLTQLVQQQAEMQQAIIGHINESTENQGEPTQEDIFDQLTQLNGMSDEELAQHGLTRADVDQAVDQFNASIGGEQGYEEGQGDQVAQGEQGGEGEMAGAAMAGVESGAPGGATALGALQREIIQLKAGIMTEKAAKKLEAETIQFAEVENKITTLASQRDQAVELAEKVIAENEALRLHIKTGTRPVAAGVDEGIRLFSANGNGELHPFQQRIKQIELSEKCSTGKALMLASKENPAAHADWLQSQTIRA